MTNLSQTRGDTATYTFQRKNASGEIITDTPDALYFTVKKAYTDKTPLIQKKIADMLAFGNYVYDIQVNDNDAVTTIAKGAFTLTPEATWQSNE